MPFLATPHIHEPLDINSGSRCSTIHPKRLPTKASNAVNNAIASIVVWCPIINVYGSHTHTHTQNASKLSAIWMWPTPTSTMTAVKWIRNLMVTIYGFIACGTDWKWNAKFAKISPHDLNKLAHIRNIAHNTVCISFGWLWDLPGVRVYDTSTASHKVATFMLI